VKHKILVLNPGSTSTEIALFEDDDLKIRVKEEYGRKQLAGRATAMEQYPIRLRDVLAIVGREKIDLSALSAVTGRGGLLKPMESGTYQVNHRMVDDIKAGKVMSEHISNIAPLMAFEIAQRVGIPAFITDPVSVDEFEPLARISGSPEIPRRALQHTLNIKAVGRRSALELGKRFVDVNLIVAHLGGGVSVCPVKRGKIVDANNANEEGPFAPERSGGLPSLSLVDFCFTSGHPKEWIKKRVVGEGGLVAYLGTNRIEEVEKRIREGDEEARLIYEAMAYQISKEIGAMATVLKGKVDKIVLTGGCAHSKLLTGWIEERVSFIAPVTVYPGADELRSLASATLRVMRGEEKAKEYE